MDLIWLALGWAGYAGLHSLLATTRSKTWLARRWPGLAPGYRLVYNLLAVILLLPLIRASWTLPGEWLWRWTGVGAWIANGLALAALGGLALAGGGYDMAEFLGLRPLREQRRDANEHDHLRLTTWHRHVRHPWYALGLLLIWTRDMNVPLLVSACAITLYLVVGSRLEERKLVAQFGPAYREYRARVPGLIPLPWRRLSQAESEDLMRRARDFRPARPH